MKIIKVIPSILLFFTLAINLASANTVNYVLDNIVQDNGKQMTGSFQWSYTKGDFEGGNGTFIDLFIPDYTDRASVNWDINDITITFDAKKSIDFSRNEGIDILDFSITLFLTNPLSPTQPINIDLNRSKYEIESGGHNGGYISGTLSPNSVPLPATLWLFISAILGLAVFPKPQSTHC